MPVKPQSIDILVQDRSDTAFFLATPEPKSFLVGGVLMSCLEPSAPSYWYWTQQRGSSNIPIGMKGKTEPVLIGKQLAAHSTLVRSETPLPLVRHV